MRAPSAAELMDAWERCEGRTPAARALELVSLSDVAAASEQTPGECNRQLIDLRERLFGPLFEGVADCPGCAETLEFSFRAEDVRAGAPSFGSDDLAVVVGGEQVAFRLPSAGDIADACREAEAGAARAVLLERCLLDHAPDELPDAALDEIDARMSALDPQANVEIALACPGCGEAWSLPFDPGSFLWVELDAWAARTAQEVHALASAYGWSEDEILELGPRRRLYLELVDS